MTDLKDRARQGTIVIFGASGDLTQRKLIPALHSLACDALLPPKLQVVGVSRTELSDNQFRKHLYPGVQKYGRLKPGVWDDFASRLYYMPGSYNDPQTYRQLEARLANLESSAGIPANRLFYLAIPPELYPKVIKRLGEAGLNRSGSGWTRIIIEKPFGRDLESAQKLNEEVHAYFGEEQIYRIDHYLGKETVQNILAFRFANFVFNEIWGRNYVDHVQIMALEDVGVEHRAGYYDRAGVLRDMVQNHMFQLLALTAMEPPATMNAKTLRDEKIKVLQDIRPFSLADGAWGQYGGYRDEEKVNPNSTTPTYVALKLFVDNWRWQGVPFYLRSGKSLVRKITEITMQFKKVPRWIFAENSDLSSNHLAICIQPNEGTHLRFELKVPGAGMRTSPVVMEFHYKDIFGDQGLPEAYERLLLDALQGDASLFARSDEIERAWELITPLLTEWERMPEPPLSIYEPGSWGPDTADELIKKDGHSWVVCCGNSSPERL